MSSAERQRRRHPGRGSKRDVTLLWCHPGSVSGGFMTSVMQMMTHDIRSGAGHFAGVIAEESSPRIANARNDLVRAFLDQTTTEWCLMLDTDMVLPPDLMDRMLAVADRDDVPLLGALCFAGGRGGEFYPTLYVMEGETGVRRYLEYPDDALVKIDGTGAACMLMHRDALAKIGAHFGEPWPWYVEGARTKGGVELGEDISFCLRAATCGFPVHVHTGIEVGHEKRWLLTSATFKALRDGHVELQEVDDDART